MPQAQPLFRAAISLSGAIEPVTPERARREASRVAQLAKVTPDRAGFASLTEDELRLLQPGGDKTPVRDRLRGLRAMWSGQLPVGPLIDGGLIPCHPLDAYAQGTGAGKPVLISTMDEEMTGPWGDWIPRPFGLVPPTLAMRWLHLTPAQARAYAGPRRALGTRHLISQAGGDLIFRRLALEVATLRGGNTWLARMPWRSPTFGDARHVVDMPFFWDVLDWPSAHKWVGPEAPQAIADALHGAAVKLIKGEPLDWPEWRPAEGHTLVLGEPVRVERHGYADVRCLARL
jgi:para-nitrobenzyl esterase